MAVLSTIERTLTRTDHLRLSRLLALQGAGAPGLEALHDLLDACDVVASAQVPATVVTMNSQVLLEDTGGGEPYQLKLCYPEDANPGGGCISVLSPVGCALLGLQVGEVARWSTAGGAAGAARILSVLFQPEAEGDHAS